MNLRTANLWKLNYGTVKGTAVDSSGYCTSLTFSNAVGGYTTVNFKSAASVDFYSETLWISGNKTITLTNGKTKTVSIPDAQDWSATYTTNGKMSVSTYVGGKAINSGEITDPGYSRGETAGRSTGWSQASAACGNSMSGINLTVTVPASTYNTTAQWKYTVAGLQGYARAGQTAYYYDQGQLRSFTIPSNTWVGNPYITTG